MFCGGVLLNISRRAPAPVARAQSASGRVVNRKKRPVLVQRA
jgi:hypothetical protein